MDLITLSSDSDASCNGNDAGTENCPPFGDSDNDIYSIAWNDDVHPAVNYDADVLSPNAEVEKLTPEKGFISPIKSSKPNTENEEWNLDIDDCSFSFPTSQSTSESETASQSVGKRKSKLSQEEREQKRLLKEQKKVEREKQREEKKAEQLRKKAVKAVLLENQRNLKPEENIKFLKVHIDNEIINSSYGVNLISLLQESNVQYMVEPHTKSYTITWSKNKTEKVVGEKGDIEERVNSKEEKELLYVLHWSKAVELIHNNELLTHVETVKSIFFDKKLTLIIYGIEKYFNFQKNKKNRNWKAEVNYKGKSKPKPKEKIFEESPLITKDQLEFALTDLQLLGKHNSRLLETPEEFSNLILNMTKSLSQIEFKLEKHKRQDDDLGWIASDSYHSVKVDKNGIGLLRLWQQQICQFSSVGFETAQAIVSHYKSPLALENQYKLRDSKEGERLLENIQIRRNVGILSSSRRIGPQLSRKIYKFFTSDDPNVEL